MAPKQPIGLLPGNQIYFYNGTRMYTTIYTINVEPVDPANGFHWYLSVDPIFKSHPQMDQDAIEEFCIYMADQFENYYRQNYEVNYSYLFKDNKWDITFSIK